MKGFNLRVFIAALMFFAVATNAYVYGPQQNITANPQNIYEYSYAVGNTSDVNITLTSGMGIAGASASQTTKGPGAVNLNIGYTGGSGEARLAQVFQLSSSQSISVIVLNMSKASSPTDLLFLTIQGANATGAPNGTIYGNSTLTGSTLSTSFANVTFNFTPIVLFSGLNYTMVLSRSGPTEGTNYYKLSANITEASQSATGITPKGHWTNQTTAWSSFKLYMWQIMELSGQSVLTSSPLISSLNDSGVLNFSNNTLPSNAQFNVLTNGSGFFRTNFSNIATSTSDLTTWEQDKANLNIFSAGVYYKPDTANQEANLTWKPFIAPQGWNFTNCLFYGSMSISSGWGMLQASGNGSTWETIYNSTSENSSIQNISKLIGNNVNQIWLRFRVYGIASGFNALIFVNQKPELNCTLVNTTITNLPIIVPGNNTLNTSQNVYATSPIQYNLTVSRNESPSLVIRAYNSLTNAQWTTIIANATQIANSSLSVSNSSTPNNYVAFAQSALWAGLTNLTISGSGLNTTYFNQTFTGPTATNHEFLNLSVHPANLYLYAFDEGTYASINATFTITNGTNTTTLTNNTFNLNYLQIPSGSLTITVNNSNYTQRTYYVTMGATSAVNLTTYLSPNDAYASLTRFHINTAQGGIVQNARIDLRKLINSAYVTVAQVYSDGTGIGAIYTNINTNYQVVVTATGYSVFSTTLTPTSQDYYITLSSSTSNTSLNYSTANLTVRLTPSIFNTSVENQNVTLNVISTDGQMQSMELQLYYANGTMFFNQSVTGSPAGAQLTTLVNLTTIKNLTPYVLAIANVQKTNFNTFSFNRTYSSLNYSSHKYSLDHALRNIGTVSGGFSNTTILIAIILISILITAWVSRYAPPGYTVFIAMGCLIMVTGAATGMENAIYLTGIIAAIWFILTKLRGVNG